MYSLRSTPSAGQPIQAAPHLVLFFGFALAAACLSACASRTDYVTPRTPPTAAETNPINESLAVLASQAAESRDYTIGPEDLLEVTLYDIEDSQGKPREVSVRVSNSGSIALPFVGTVDASDKTATELEGHLREAYTKYIHEPEVSVFVREYRSYEISVIGYVERPGIVGLKGRKTLLEAIGLVGGLNKDAGRTVRLTRAAKGEVFTELIDLEHLVEAGSAAGNPVLLPGDVINVPKAGVFYVEGMVQQPGAFPLIQDTTVTQAIATAGGPDMNTAKESGTTLFRIQQTGVREAIPIDIAAIRRGEASDFLIREDDLIVVPLSGPKFVLDRLIGIVRVGVNTAY